MDFSNLKKLDANIRRVPDREAGGRVTAIVKVRRANYHPNLLTVRRQIDQLLFTAEFEAKDLRTLESDPLVEHVSTAKPLPSY